MNTESLSDQVNALLENVFEIWCSKQPVAASAWRSSKSLGGEDVTDDGLATWSQFIEVVSQQVEAYLLQENIHTLDKAVLLELRRFCDEQKLLHNELSVYKVQIGSLLQLIAFGLLPVSLAHSSFNSGTWHDGDTKARLEACCSWLSVAEDRLTQGEMRLTRKDLHVVLALKRAINEEPYIRFKEAMYVSRHLERLASYDSSEDQSTTQKRVTLSRRLEALMGRAWYSDTLSFRLYKKLEQDVTLITELYTTLPRSTVETPQDPTHTIWKWVQQTETKVRKVAQTRFGELERPANILSMPNVLSPFVSDAVYIPPGITGGPVDGSGWLLLGRAYTSLPNSPSGRASIALVIAHELHLGHGKQWSLSQHSPLKKLHQITRNPTGLEGWAQFAEELLIDEEDRYIAVVALLQRIRRFATSWYFLRIREVGKEETGLELSRVLATAPTLVRERLFETLQANLKTAWSMLPYSVGYLETQHAVKRVEDVRALWPLHRLYKAYLNWGPLAPKLVADLIIE